MQVKTNIIQSRRAKATLASLFLSLGTPALGDCGALQPLAVIHDAYRAILSNDVANDQRVYAANQLLELVPIYTAKSFADDLEAMSLDVDILRFEDVMVDALLLSRSALSGQVPVTLPAKHRQNAEWLTNLVARTGCFKNVARGGHVPLTGSFSLPPPGTPTEERRAPAKPGPSEDILLIIAGLILAAAAGYLVYHSRRFRIKRTDRLPRHKVAFKARADFGDTTTPVIVLDVSQGGAKIECDHPPVAGESIKLYLPCGEVPASIVWATAYYAGVMFDKQLPQATFEQLLQDDSVTTRSRITNVF
jgi:hypothetical protein